MNADYVENIIRNIDKQSYKCILVDGAWGIGKSYMVKKALEDMKDRTCFISLFGMDDCQKFTMKHFFSLPLGHLAAEKLQVACRILRKRRETFVQRFPMLVMHWHRQYLNVNCSQ